jgi:hypothetical protein
MNDLIKQLNDISVANTYKSHDLLERVLNIESVNFPTNDINFDQERVAFVCNVDDFAIVVQRDLNSFTVVARVAKGNDVVAECVINIMGEFNERYTNRIDSDLKAKVSAWFTEIGKINVQELITGEPPEAEPNVPDEEAPEVEVVSEGEGTPAPEAPKAE